jgi:hypothetical protein
MFTKLITHKKTKDKHLKLRLRAGSPGALLPPTSDILGSPLAPMGPLGYHVLGGLIQL